MTKSFNCVSIYATISNNLKICPNFLFFISEQTLIRMNYDRKEHFVDKTCKLAQHLPFNSNLLGISQKTFNLRPVSPWQVLRWGGVLLRPPHTSRKPRKAAYRPSMPIRGVIYFYYNIIIAWLRLSRYLNC